MVSDKKFYDYLFNKLLIEKVSLFPLDATKVIFSIIFEELSIRRYCNYEYVLNIAFFEKSIVFQKQEFILGVRIIMIWMLSEFSLGPESKTIDDYKEFIKGIVIRNLKPVVDVPRINRCSMLLTRDIIYNIKHLECIYLSYMTFMLSKKFIFLKKEILHILVKDIYIYLNEMGILDTSGLMIGDLVD